MIKLLDSDYKITVSNMINITEEIGDFKVTNSTFINEEGFKISKNILVNDVKQIFSMNDGLFILEIENRDDDECEYFYSDNINELTSPHFIIIINQINDEVEIVTVDNFIVEDFEEWLENIEDWTQEELQDLGVYEFDGWDEYKSYIQISNENEDWKENFDKVVELVKNYVK